ncbi:MAG: hypothetical protein P9L92_02055 [Candidatus Electryonea clarkiae]|nr:hypothetical protein [Candidatus Electryonea clarkiae]MDP8289284.1 hypothetical protein [Candidatus Electryonea clarkiae]
MEATNKLLKGKNGVIINYAGLLAIIICFVVLDQIGWNAGLIAGILITLVITVITYVKVHIKSNLWKLTHSRAEKLDEREVLITHEALSYSYSIFSVICLSILFLIVLSLDSSFSERLTIIRSAAKIIVICMIYFAHTLPSSIIAWKGNYS